MNNNKIPPSAVGGGGNAPDTLGTNKKRNDMIFIGALLIAVILIGLLFFFLRGEGDSVTVTVDGELFGVYSLSRDAVVEIRTGERGEQLNRLVIRDGEAFVETATCPDGICSAHRPISRDGESIVCLPHRVVVTVEQEQK